MAERPTRSSERPGSVVMQAYLAAHRGRYVDANRHLAPSVMRNAERCATSIRQSRKSMAKTLPRIPAAQRRQFRRFLAATRPFEDSGFCVRSEWRSRTRNRSIESLEVVSERVRHAHATVSLRLRLKGAKVVEESQRLVRVRGRWYIG
jgi:hypothetical protein